MWWARWCETDTTFTDLISCSFCVITLSARRVDHVSSLCKGVEQRVLTFGLELPVCTRAHIPSAMSRPHSLTKKMRVWGWKRERTPSLHPHWLTHFWLSSFANVQTRLVFGPFGSRNCFGVLWLYSYMNKSSAEVSWTHVPVLSLRHQRNRNHPYRALLASRPSPRRQGQWRHGRGRPRGHWSYCEKNGGL